MLHFATLFDSNYLSRGLSLHASLQEHSSQPFEIHVLALDENVVDFFRNNSYPNVTVITIEELESEFPELLTAKLNRSKVEYYFTLSPILPLYIFRKNKGLGSILTIDADVYFFDDPVEILSKYSDASILITPHAFSKQLAHLVEYGKYNVSFQLFKNNAEGLKCLNDWKEKCLDWCFDYLDKANGRFADQKYLDNWETDFNATEIIYPGAGIAPWNIDAYSYDLKNGKVYIGNAPLIYFHFHHLRIFNKYFALDGLSSYKVKTPKKILKAIYFPYLRSLNSFSRQKFRSKDSVLRFNSGQQGLLQKLLKTNGYWFFTRYFIMRVNFNSLFKRLYRR